MELAKCSVCIKKYIPLVSVQDSDEDDIKWFTKLQEVIPELEWLEEYMLCEHCMKLLEEAWRFKKFVVSLDTDRQTLKSVLRSSSCKLEYFNNYGNEYFCDICLKIFTNLSEVQQHKQFNECVSHDQSDSKNFFCYKCSASFNMKDDLIHHIEQECELKIYHNEAVLEKFDERETTNDESKDCADAEDLPEFVKVSKTHQICIDKSNTSEPYKYFCEKCNITFLEISEYKVHLHQHNLQEQPVCKKRRGRKPLKKFSCEICKGVFDYVKLVIEHCVLVHSMNMKEVKPYSCEKCDMRFASSANLDQHRNYHNKNRTHICSLCGKGFITKSDLTVHEYTHYNRRNYKCALCDKAFNTNKNLRTHNLVVHTDRSLWKYGCTLCDKRFPLKTNYDQHLRRHTGEKEHACHICKKTFISKSELQRHIHMHSNIRAFKCSNCDKEYKERRTYQAHLAKKHGIGTVKITVREKKFVCHICPSQFYDKQKLMRHICSHSGIKPFPCYICDKKFTDKSYLKHHLKTAHNIVEQLSIDV